VTVYASDFQFTDSSVTINPGDTVTWMNSGGLHNVEFNDGSFTMPASPSPASWTVARTFMAAGTFNYVCGQHPSMTGTVIVAGITPPPPPPPPPGDPGGGGGGGGTGGGGTGGGGGGTGTPGSGSPGAGKSSTAITLQVSDATPAKGSRIRFFGSVRPQQDGRRVQLQRRGRRGAYRTVARIRLSDAGASRSNFSKRLRVLADAVFRARLPADDDHKAGTSRTRRVNVP
jgi:hypothetical protein